MKKNQIDNIDDVDLLEEELLAGTTLVAAENLVTDYEVREFVAKNNFNGLPPLPSFYDFFSSIIDILKPEPLEPVSTTIERIMRIPATRGLSKPFSVRGRAAYMREPLDTLNSRHYNELIFMGCARSGKTQALVTGFASYAMYTARPIIVFQMNGEKALEFAKKEFIPTVNASPDLAKLLGTSREDKNLTMYKLKSGSYVLIRKPAVADMASTTIQCVALTDFDRMPTNVEGEGNPWDLAKARTTTYGIDAMAVAESSPGFDVKNPDKRLDPHDSYSCDGIAALYNVGDKRCYYFQCLACQEYFWATPETITYDVIEGNIRGSSKTARVECPHCGRHHTDQERIRHLIPKGVWLKKGQKIDKHGNITGEVVENTRASFWLRAPACGFISLEEIVFRYLTAKQQYEDTGDDQSLKVVVNTTFGDPYVPVASKGAAEAVYQKELDSAMNNEIGVAPRDTVSIVACVDVQNGKDSRFIVQIFAYTREGKIHLIDRFSIRKWKGKKIHTDINDSTDWEAIEYDVMEYRARIKDTNLTMRPRMTLVDSGGRNYTTDNAYNFYEHIVRSGKSARLRLVKGMTTPLNFNGGQAWAVWDTAVRKDTKLAKRGFRLFKIFPDPFKNMVYNLLQRPLDQPKSISFNKGIPKEVYEELAAESLGLDGKYSLDAPDKRNEALDLFVYFLAYLQESNLELSVRMGRSNAEICTAEEGNINAFDAVTNTPVIDASPQQDESEEELEAEIVDDFNFGRRKLF
ncbi:hypothetical protein CKF54_00430 [Psittacicella hinzii]|uniref:Uncharacterized protein n=1 Tax=Psittacicella hinzii TaxID=2028575 RepID=A0A3A1YAX6_9GAMM|nr:terminase gpA endonuclease subunit [Psittacicella hinzii]RIY34496.1 hypothetical protein CKF54_00430 [Psittacicella hinzii]